jgi:hypothetical protein
MSTPSDLFQRLISLPNAKPDHLPALVIEVIRELERLQVRIKRSRVDLIPTGRSHYLQLVAGRGRHHLDSAAEFHRKNAAKLKVSTTGDRGHQLRNFYHDCYYAVFYAARYGLVSLGLCDLSLHASLPNHLKMHSDTRKSELKRPGLPAPEETRLKAEAAAFDETKALLEEFKKDRETGDYVMNLQLLSLLADVPLMKGRVDRVRALFAAWAVP